MTEQLRVQATLELLRQQLEKRIARLERDIAEHEALATHGAMYSTRYYELCGALAELRWMNEAVTK